MQIVTARGFELRERVEYRGGDLHYQVNDQYYTVIRLYREKTREPPKWFDLQKWTDFQTYFEGQDPIQNNPAHVNLLLYNEQIGSAYFIGWQRMSD